jgi:hypothetical protein
MVKEGYRPSVVLAACTRRRGCVVDPAGTPLGQRARRRACPRTRDAL